MNSTNRVANRLLLVVVGIVLLAAGALAVVLAAVPGAARGWTTQGATIGRTAPSWTTEPVVGSASALALGIGGAAVLLVVLLVVFIARQGHGHTTRVIEQHAGPAGTTLVDLGVPRALLEADLSGRPELVATRVSAYRVRRTPTLKVSVRCRRGVSPVAAARIVTTSLEGLDAVLGRSLPALVQISGGIRSRTSSRARLD